MSHSDGALINDKFCTQRKQPCKDGKNYRTICAVPWTYQAHHVLCVASVTQYISSDTRIVEVVKRTDYCNNVLENMLAMPPYLGTVSKYYLECLKNGDFSTPPGFADIPVHGYDHLSTKGYKNDIDKEMMAIADRAAKSKKKHELTSADMLDEITSYRDTMKTDLKDYGSTRGAGTHKEFLKVFSGAKGPDSDWYKPFSMAKAKNIEKKTFPLTVTAATAAKVKKLVTGLI